SSWGKRCLFHLHFFFCQAEDGIRDFHVTGVQTCALPILELEVVPNIQFGLRPCMKDQFPVTGNCIIKTPIWIYVPVKTICIAGEIGRASCRERGWLLSVVGAAK